MNKPIRISMTAVMVWAFLSIPLLVSAAGEGKADLLGHFQTPGTVVDLALVGDFAYVAAWTSGIQVVDVSDIGAPVLAGNTSLPGEARRVVAYGGRLYVASGNGGLQILELGNPVSPTVQGTFATDIADDVEVVGSYAFLIDAYGLKVINVSNPSSPTLTGSLDLYGRRIVVEGNYAYITTSTDGLLVVDVSIRSNPRLVHTVETTSRLRGLAVGGDQLYVCGEEDGVLIADISSPLSASFINQLSLPLDASAVEVIGSRAYVACTTEWFEPGSLELLDVSLPSSPTLIESVALSDWAHPFAIADGIAYIPVGSMLTSGGGISFVDISETPPPEPPVAIIAEMGGEVNVGEDLQFSSNSTGDIVSYLWDFGDGSTSTEMNPVHAFSTGGIFEVTLTVSGPVGEDSVQILMTVFSVAPQVLTVRDVPLDQGGRVFMDFRRSMYDDTGLTLADIYSIQRLHDDQWINVGSLGAYGENEYTAEVLTYVDGVETQFRVIAHMGEGNFASNVVAGISTDDIAPAVPADLAWGTGQTSLVWSPVSDEDLAFYRVWGCDEPEFHPGAALEVATVTSVSIDLETPHSFRYYFVTAVDHFGNESEAAEAAISVSGIPVSPMPMVKIQAHPNPFNPQTVVNFVNPRAGDVSLVVYDIQGHLVRTLLSESLDAGEHSRVWDGRTDDGHRAASGVYFARMVAGDDVAIVKLMMVK